MLSESGGKIVLVLAVAVAIVASSGCSSRVRTDGGGQALLPGSVAASIAAAPGSPGTSADTIPRAIAGKGQTSVSPKTPGWPAGSPASKAGGAPAPVTEPVKLERVTTPPAKTLAALPPSSANEGAEYAITFVPYGTARGGAGESGSLVIRVLSSKPIGKIDHPYEFKGRNLLVDCSKIPAARAITRGGTYKGILTFVARDGLLVAQLLTEGTLN